MKLFGSIKEVVALVFRKNTNEITVRPNQATNYTSARDIQLSPGDADAILLSEDSTQTITNKTISGLDNTISNIDLGSQTGGILTASRGGTGVSNAATLTLGLDAITVTTSGTTAVTLPTSGTLATRAGSETLTNKTIAGGSNTITGLALTTAVTGVLPAANGGTGVANTNTLSIGSNNIALTTSGSTTVTLPTSGTLSTLAGTEQLTNKDFAGGTASNTSRITVPKNTTTNLSGLTRKAGTILYDTDLNSLKFDDGTNLNVLATSASSLDSATDVKNLALATSVATSAMTVALKNKAASDPSSGDPVTIGFRNSTAATGTYTVRSVTAATSVVIASGATLGLTSGVDSFIYVYALDNSGTVELAVSPKRFDDHSVQSSTTMSGSATSAITLYSTTGRSNVPVRLIGRIKSNQTTSGTYAANAVELTVGNIRTGDILGRADGLSVPTGAIGEVVTTGAISDFTKTSPVNGTWYDVVGASITLTAGSWRLEAYGIHSITTNNATGLASSRFGILDSGSNPLLVHYGTYSYGTSSANTSGTPNSGYISLLQNITTSTTYKLSISYFLVTGSPAPTSIDTYARSQSPIVLRATRIA